jgi:hypothetical protein
MTKTKKFVYNFCIRYCILFVIFGLVLGIYSLCLASDIKQPNVAGKFYPSEAEELSVMLDRFFKQASSQSVEGDILVIISPHAGYEFSGPTAAYGYKLIEDESYDTVVILAPSHYVNFEGVAVWSEGTFRTPLGNIAVDADSAQRLLLSERIFSDYKEPFLKEHSVEVQLPFLQKALKNFTILPLIMGRNNFLQCQQIARAINKITQSKHCLIVASSDMYHGFDYKQAEFIDSYTFSLIKGLKPAELYQRLGEGKAQLCGGIPVVTAMLIAQEKGYGRVLVLKYTNSAGVMGRKKTGEYCVGYGSVVIYNSSKRDGSKSREGGETMLNAQQRKRLLEIARESIKTYLSTGKKLEINEEDPLLIRESGAFVTLHKQGQLRGCIGSLRVNGPLYLTIRDMAIEAAVGDPRFPALQLSQLQDIEIEISVLSPLKKVNTPNEIELGRHGVLIKRGPRSGVFLPQVATETGWSKQEFLSYLCAHKAGLPADAWRDKSTEIYVFTAEVFSEKDIRHIKGNE